MENILDRAVRIDFLSAVGHGLGALADLAEGFGLDWTSSAVCAVSGLGELGPRGEAVGAGRGEGLAQSREVERLAQGSGVVILQLVTSLKRSQTLTRRKYSQRQAGRRRVRALMTSIERTALA